MLAFFKYFLPLVAMSVAMSIYETPLKNQVIHIDNGTLRNIQFLKNPSPELNLSGLPYLRALEKDAFDNVLDVESLLLANNSLTSLPEFVFSNLTKLKNLSLSGNQISSVRYLFVGLENLQLLDISRNSIQHLRRGDLFGLTKSVKILIDKNILWSISTGVFTNSFLKNADELKKLAIIHDQENPIEENPIEENHIEQNEKEEEVDDAEQINETLSKDIKVKLCKSDDIVTSLQILEKDEELIKDCVQVPIDTDEKKVDLREQGVKGFQEDWYQLQSLPIVSLDFSNNDITEITKETLNDLPAYLTYVNFLGNKIRRIWSQVIENDHLRRLNFKDNLIEEIEENALEKTKLKGLFLVGNQLEGLNFVSSLPESLSELVVSGNHINSIPEGAFDRLSRLRYLNLDENKIETLQNNSFQGLKSLQALSLIKNDITTIEPTAFKGLTALKMLDLHRNFIRNVGKDIFVELTALKELNLANNKITKVTFADLPQSVDSLHLDYNEINVLEKGNFVQAPKFTLSLTGNNISSIAQGAFNLPTLKDLYLNNNTLTTIEGDSYEGLNRLRNLWLSENKISEIQKGACKNLGSLYILDISRNPFEKLENGALHGLNTAFGTSLYIYENNLKEMQGGIFDDA